MGSWPVILSLTGCKPILLMDRVISHFENRCSYDTSQFPVPRVVIGG